MRNNLVVFSLLSMLAPVFIGCSKAGLDRSIAKDALNKHPTLTRVSVVKLDFRCLIDQGYLAEHHGIFKYFKLTPKGEEIFSRVDNDFHYGELKKPATARVKEITGITDEMGEKAVEYTIEFRGDPSVLSSCATNAKEPKRTYFKQYDDGWRVREEK